jgi:hypothetical protein
MPALIIMYAQTNRIARFAARLARLYPTTSLEDGLKSDQLFDHTAEMQAFTTPLFTDGVPGLAPAPIRGQVQSGRPASQTGRPCGSR